MTNINTYMLIPYGEGEMFFKKSLPEIEFVFGLADAPLDRFRRLLTVDKFDYIVRLTADCPLITRTLILDMAYQVDQNSILFMYNELDGMDIQIAHRSIFDHEIYLDNEHVFNMVNIKEHGLYTKWEMHLSVDTKYQYEHIKFLVGDSI